ncbi:MAG TPA: hypothetical protein VJ697_00165 [Nitrososphaeraceae archaeon]|nr:hypothetical protein [Nitrososphaeraceae archaeon]
MSQEDNNIELYNRITIAIIAVATIFILFVNIGSNFIDTYAQEQQQNGASSSPSVELTAKLVNNEYRWVGFNNSTNPILNITSGTDNQITIKSMKGDPVEHELRIEGISADGDEEGDEIAKSDEIEDGSSTTVNFNTSDFDPGDYQSIEYYCEYHPDTMRGKIQINLEN